MLPTQANIKCPNHLRKRSSLGHRGHKNWPNRDHFVGLLTTSQFVPCARKRAGRFFFFGRSSEKEKERRKRPLPLLSEMAPQSREIVRCLNVHQLSIMIMGDWILWFLMRWNFRLRGRILMFSTRVVFVGRETRHRCGRKGKEISLKIYGCPESYLVNVLLVAVVII